MKNIYNFKSLFHTSLVALCLITVGVGEMWGNTTHPIYCAIKSSSLGSGTLKINVHKGSSKDGNVWFRTTMEKMPTTIHKAATGETKDLYYGMIEYVEEGLQEIQFEIWDGDDKREWHSAFSGWWTSDGYTKPVYDYENKNFTTYPASLSEKTSYVYFNAADWTDDYIQLGVGHGLYQGYNQLSPLTNTTLYYGNPSLNYGDAVHITFLGHYENFGTGNNWLTDLTSHANHYAGFLHYSLVENNFYYFSRNSGDANGTALSYSHLGSESTSYQSLNKTQTVQARVKATGSSYSDAAFASWPGSVSVARTYMSSASATTTPSAANMTSATTDAVITSSITLTASANSGYYFEGWGDASNSNPTDGTAAKTYTITDAKTSYAFFSQAYTLTYERKGDYSTSTVTCYSVADYSGTTTSGSSIPTGHLITLVATPATGYEVKGWYSDASCASAYTSGSGGVTIEDSNNTFKLASLNANTEVYPKFGPITYSITLEDMDPTTSGQGSVDVTYNASTNMTSSDPVTKPTKDHYNFGGYWTSENTGTTLDHQLIDEDGNWIADVDGYTSNDGAGHPTWVHDYPISLYAKWTEIKHDVTIAVSPAGAGSVQVSGSPITSVENIGYETHSAEMTAVPVNAVWVFKEWQVTSNAHLDLEHYSTTGTTMKITATGDDQTVTAVFQKRYELVGSVWDGSSTGGMPGWEYDGTGEFTINSFSAVDTENGVDLSYTCTLTSNTAYKLRINDRGASAVYGKNDPAADYYTLPANTSAELSNYGDGSEDVWIQTGDASGLFTFRITKMRNAGSGNMYYPTISVDRPQQVNFGWKYINIGGSLTSGDVGGTVAVAKKSDASAVSTGSWLPYGTVVTYTATPTPGYTVNWHVKSDYSDNPFSHSYSFDHAGTSTGNGYAEFSENATTVTLANNGHGKVQIGGVDATSTTCGVTTTRSLTAVPDDGYMFSSWTKTSGDDITLSFTSTNPTTLTGLGSGATSGQTVTANFTERWQLKAESVGWGSATFTISNISTVGGDAVGYVDISLSANTDYQFTIVDLQESATYKTGSDQVYYMTNGNSHNWTFATDKTYNCGITTAGAGTYRFTWNITDKTMSVTYPNFVIYRSGDKAGDPRATGDDVESYAGGTITKAIEYRMKVHTLDQWYSLCLPFTVSAVKVWDDEDEAYYDLVPYYRTSVDGKLNGGHYIIRTPSTATDLALADFDDWRDPTNPTGYVPSKNTPYIIQWHMSYFQYKYISFFGATGQTIPTSMTAGSAPSSDNVVNVCGNDAMTSGTVKNAYLLESDYGPGAWLREEIGTNRTIPPFECYLLASSITAPRYAVIRRGMMTNDTPTGWEDVLNSERKTNITVYSVSGFLVTRFTDCSISEAAKQLRAEQHEGLYILCTDNENVKLILGGK